MNNKINNNMNNETHIQVYFMRPELGKKYFHAEATIRDNGKYYAPKDKLKFMGEYTHMKRWGWGDGSGGSYHFTNDSVIASYEGRTCFLELSQFEIGLSEYLKYDYDHQTIVDLKEFLG